MRIKDIAEGLKDNPGMRIRISRISMVDDQGCRIYTEALTDAQILAYWERPVISMEADGKTLYCVIV